MVYLFCRWSSNHANVAVFSLRLDGFGLELYFFKFIFVCALFPEHARLLLNDLSLRARVASGQVHHQRGITISICLHRILDLSFDRWQRSVAET